MKLFKYIELVSIGTITLVLNSCGGGNNNHENNQSLQEPINSDAPIITLIGKKTLYLQHGKKYIEPGATAEDEDDGEVDVTTSGEVDVMTVGTYSITYTAEDSDEHITTTQRKIIVEPILHHGITYLPIVSQNTGKIWLDRNIGATSACKDIGADFEYATTTCIGDLYQWGRNPDGHQKSNSAVSTIQTSGMETQDGKFIDGHDDWSTSTHRNANWSKTDGSSVCPVHYKVPSLQDTKNETDLVVSLKIPFISIRITTPNKHIKEDLHIVRGERVWIHDPIIWTSTPLDSTHAYINDYRFISYQRSLGIPVRCIQE